MKTTKPTISREPSYLPGDMVLVKAGRSNYDLAQWVDVIVKVEQLRNKTWMYYGQRTGYVDKDIVKKLNQTDKAAIADQQRQLLDRLLEHEEEYYVIDEGGYEAEKDPTIAVPVSVIKDIREGL